MSLVLPYRMPDKFAPPVGSDEHRNCLQRVLQMISDGEDLARVKINEFQQYYRAFQGMHHDNRVNLKDDWQSDLRPGYIFQIIMELLPRLVDKRPRFQPVPQELPSDPYVMRSHKQLLDHWLWRDKFNIVQVQSMLHACIFGEGWTKQGWLHNTRHRPVRSSWQELQMGYPPLYMKELTVNDRPTSTIIHPFDVVHDPGGLSMETLKWGGSRTIVPLAELKRKQRRQTPDGKWVGCYENIEHVTAAGASADRENKLPDEYPEHVKRRLGKDGVELIELFDMVTDRKYVVANRSVIIQDIPQPYWHCDIPLSCAITQPGVMRLGGISEADKLDALQQFTWLMENQRLDNTRLSMDVVLMIRDTIENFDEFIIEPGAKWAMPNPGADVRVLDMPQPQLASMQDIESLRGRMQSIAGTAYMGGADPNSAGFNQDTASGLLTLVEQSNMRVDFRLMLARTLHYERIGEQFMALGGQYMTKPEVAGFGEMDPIPVPPELLARKHWYRYDYMTDSAMKSMRQQMTQTLLMSLTPLLQTPIPTREGVKYVNPGIIVDALAESFDRDPGEMMVSGDEMAVAQQQMMQMLMPPGAPAPGAPVPATTGADPLAADPNAQATY